MKIIYSTKDYETDRISVVFEDTLVESELLEYVSQHYPINGPGIYQIGEVVKSSNRNAVFVDITVFHFTKREREKLDK